MSGIDFWCRLCYNVRPMDKDNTQKELFEFEQTRKQPKGFGQLFQKADFAVSLSAERMVFVSIGIMMLLVVSFALGVERGKAVSAGAPASTEIPCSRAGSAVEKAAVVTQPAAQPRIAAGAPVQQAVRAKAQPLVAKKAQISTQPQAADDKSKPYTIVAAAFSKEVFAAQEVNRLKTGGIEAFVCHGEPYYLACVGAFASKDSAQKTLNKVRQIHRDAYVRLK